MPQQLILALTLLATGAVAFVCLQMKNLALAGAALLAFLVTLVVLIVQTRRMQKIEAKVAIYNALLGAKVSQGFERDDPVVLAAVTELPELQKKLERFKGRPRPKGEIVAVRHHKIRPPAHAAQPNDLDELEGGKPSGILRAWHYHPDTRTLEATAWAEAGDALDAQETELIRQTLRDKRTADGHPVDEIRVVFIHREQAQPHHVALRALGCRVFHYGATPQELVEMP